jgi:elongation factor P hydroxylase
VDFGYWYAPDGRSAAQQRAFEAVEYRPQAMEWHFARACGFRFRVSLDNLEADDDAVGEGRAFRTRVWQQARLWQAAGLPPRAARFAMALRREFRQAGEASDFTLAELD